MSNVRLAINYSKVLNIRLKKTLISIIVYCRAQGGDEAFSCKLDKKRCCLRESERAGIQRNYRKSVRNLLDSLPNKTKNNFSGK